MQGKVAISRATYKFLLFFLPSPKTTVQHVSLPFLFLFYTSIVICINSEVELANICVHRHFLSPFLNWPNFNLSSRLTWLPDIAGFNQIESYIYEYVYQGLNCHFTLIFFTHLQRMVDEEELQFHEEYMNEQDPSILHFLLASGDDVRYS